MTYSSTWRPSASAKKYNWLTPNGETIPGIALMHRHKVLAHMTPVEARAMADKLLDYADKIDTEDTQ
ncbi:hypothetical protein [Glutamicibacter arilaitensis]|uniref:hypothetical protein n=1 Tax=Glutamicibacter arilaitensis TaxID=256701 RepID=UPI003F92D3D4